MIDSSTGVRPQESKSSRGFAWNTLCIIHVYFRAQLLKKEVNSFYFISIAWELLKFFIMALSAQSNGTVGWFQRSVKLDNLFIIIVYNFISMFSTTKGGFSLIADILAENFFNRDLAPKPWLQVSPD